MSDQSADSIYAMAGFWKRWEMLSAPVTGELLADARLGAGERVVDIGCGAGLATFAAAEAVGGAGRVVAFDLSVETLEIVRQRAAERGVANIDTVAGDMERDDIEGAPFEGSDEEWDAYMDSALPNAADEAQLKELFKQEWVANKPMSARQIASGIGAKV